MNKKRKRFKNKNNKKTKYIKNNKNILLFWNIVLMADNLKKKKEK